MSTLPVLWIMSLSCAFEELSLIAPRRLFADACRDRLPFGVVFLHLLKERVGTGSERNETGRLADGVLDLRQRHRLPGGLRQPRDDRRRRLARRVKRVPVLHDESRITEFGRGR